MGAILKLTAIVYILLMGLGVASIDPYGAPANQNRASVTQVLDRLFISLTLAQAPPPPDDGSGQPNGETGDAGSRV